MNNMFKDTDDIKKINEYVYNGKKIEVWEQKLPGHIIHYAMLFNTIVTVDGIVVYYEPNITTCFIEIIIGVD